MEYFIEVIKDSKLVGHKRITNKSVGYVAGWSQAMQDKGYEIKFISDVSAV